jgi:hypothetical protein
MLNLLYLPLYQFNGTKFLTLTPKIMNLSKKVANNKKEVFSTDLLIGIALIAVAFYASLCILHSIIS